MNNYADLVHGKVDPEKNSIKKIYIDNILSEKLKYDGKKWISCCKYENCDRESEIKDLCEEHYNLQKRICIEGKKVTRGSNVYMWSGSEYKLICSINFCENFATSATSGVCKNHLKNKPIMYSSNQSLSFIYKNIRDDFYIYREKLKKIEKEKEKK
jgi:hypothetical protein